MALPSSLIREHFYLWKTLTKLRPLHLPEVHLSLRRVVDHRLQVTSYAHRALDLRQSDWLRMVRDRDQVVDLVTCLVHVGLRWRCKASA